VVSTAVCSMASQFLAFPNTQHQSDSNDYIPLILSLIAPDYSHIEEVQPCRAVTPIAASAASAVRMPPLRNYPDKCL
jgi:hypothetical protein